MGKNKVTGSVRTGSLETPDTHHGRKRLASLPFTRGKARDGKGQLDCGEETTPEDPLQREAGFPLRPPAAAVGRGHGSAGTLA